MGAKRYGHFMQLCLLCWACIAWRSAEAKLRARGGRFTRDLSDYDAMVPRKVDAEGAFQSYDLPHFYNLEEARTRSRRGATEEAAHVRYELSLGGRARVVELWPNHAFLSPGLVVERRRRDLWRGDPSLRRARRDQCHYVGHVRGVPESRAAVSACLDGLVGYVHTGDDRYFVEPQAEARPDASGRHVHVVFRADNSTQGRLRRGKEDENDFGGGGSSGFCGIRGSWQSAWQERFAREIEANPHFPKVLENSGNSTLFARFLELLVVVDKKFIEFHKDHDTENYILTLMNMVSNYYRDASLGRTLEVVVVRIILLEKEEEELDLTISSKAEETLSSFKIWAQRINPADPRHPNHHDIAVLITRFDICTENDSTCSILGLATMVAACQPEHAACISVDSGLSTGMTITHELGHIMGCAHDENMQDGGPGCSPVAPDGTAHVMAAQMSPRSAAWSNCSRRFIGALLDGGMGECLLDEPSGHLYQGLDMPPGAMYDAGYQCKDAMGSEEICPWKKDELCRALWCRTSSKTCATPGKPAADGTSCGEGKWCFAGACVPMGARPASEDGAWGPWGAWSECSRTCGAGVEASQRRCDSPAPRNRGRYCLGERKRYRVCNAEPCDWRQPTFREVQCSEFDDKPFSGKLYKWKPYTHVKGSECELLCYNDVPFYASLAPLVKDGTHCRKGSHDICVGGQCVPVGCDWVLGSNTVEDMCGECGGDSSTCQFKESVYKTINGKGYEVIATVPQGSYNVRIEEKEPSVNTIAVSDKCGKHFFLNGNNSEYANGEYSFGEGVLGVYSHPEPERESLLIAGPTGEDLLIYAVFYGHPNPGIYVSFYVRNSTGYIPTYRWEFLEWEPCSARCGGGSQISRPTCVEKQAGKVSDSFCNAVCKPDAKHRACNKQLCPARWHTGAWSRCSGCLNHPGKQNRSVECRSDNPIIPGEPVLTEVSKCSGERPNNTQTCDSDQPCKDQQGTEEKRTSAPFLQQSKLTTLSNYSTSHFISKTDSIAVNTTERLTKSVPVLSTLNKNLKPQLLQTTDFSLSNADHTTTRIYNSDFQYISGSSKSSKCSSISLNKFNDHEPQQNISTEYNTYRRFATVDTSSVIFKSELTSTFSSSSIITPEPKAIPVPEMHICASSTSPTKTVVDRISQNQIILKEAPLIGASCNKSLSEKAEQEMGENLADTLDTSKEKVFKGKKALERTKEIKHEQEKEHKLPV
ncbi:Papilin [Gryllus bimaculatus]|nr:Papilin [Gryllus bimaculatus]